MGRVSDAKVRLMEAVSELIWTCSYGSTTIDQICERAGVKKGSFYYFFKSKADVAAAALDVEWKLRRADLDAIFSSTVPPLDRLRNYCEYNYKVQKEVRAKFGHVLGCPLYALGCEISTQDGQLAKKVQEILDQKQRYLETAVRDAHAAKLIHAPDAAAKAKTLFAYYQGLVTGARIQDNLEMIREGVQGTFELLGVKENQLKAA